MHDLEQVSRWLAGELSVEEASAVEAQVAADPQLASQVEAMREVIAGLEALPALPAGVQRPVAPPRRPVAWRWAAAAMIAGGLGFGGGWAAAPPSTVQWAGGTLVVDGDVAVQTAEEGSVKRAMAGVAVVLVSGAAWWMQPGAEGVPLEQGVPVVVTPGVRTMVPVAARPAPVARDDGEVATLRQQADRLRFENALLRGALARHEGEAQGFPEGYPAELSPDGFEDAIAPLVEDDPELALFAVDCAEYPCIAWVEASGEKDRRWEDTLEALQGRVEGREGWGNHWVWSFPYVQRENDGSRAMVGLMVHPGVVSEDVGTRIRFRAELGQEELRSAWAEE